MEAKQKILSLIFTLLPGRTKSDKETIQKAEVDRITKKSWVEKVTDDSNVWLQAVRLEAEGDFEGASGYFLEDAEHYKSKGLDARVALSLVCAGRCKAKLGNVKEARKFYRDAGVFYTNFAEKALESSPHEASWAFEKAAECYKYGAYATKAKELKDRSKDIEKILKPLPLNARRSGARR
jgi:hypothetical protein